MAESRPYHHGALREALIAAAVAIIEERGVEHVSVREAAKRAGVSPGAPFRHFRTKAALLTAVAEQAMERLTAAVAAAQDGVDDPLAAIEAIGQGYLDWALAHPTHFQIISSRTLIDFQDSEPLIRQNAAIRARMAALVAEARAQGRLPAEADPDLILLGCRALVYGLARMAIDGHLPEWHPGEPAGEALRRTLRLHMAQLGR